MANQDPLNKNATGAPEKSMPRPLVSHRTAAACAMTLSNMLQHKAYAEMTRRAAQTAHAQWLMGLAIDAVEMTSLVQMTPEVVPSAGTPKQAPDGVVAAAPPGGPTPAEEAVPGLGVTAETAISKAKETLPILPDARLNNLQARPASRRPALRVLKSQRKEYAQAMAGLEWLTRAALGEVLRVRKDEAPKLRALLSTLGQDQVLLPGDCREELQGLLGSGR